MKKSVLALIVVLIVLVVLLLIANVFLMLRKDSGVLLNRHAEESSLNQRLLKIEADSLLAEKSVGERAGEAVGNLQAQGIESLKVFEGQTQKTTEELDKTRRELEKITAQTMQTYGEQVNQLAVEFSKTAQLTLQSLNQEIQKFNETLKKQQEQLKKT